MIVDARIERGEAAPASWLDAGLAIARATRGYTFIAMPAAVAPAAALVAAWPGVPAVAWSSRELVLVGIGVARELRGVGPDRWRQIAETRVTAGAVVVDGRQVGSPPALARPRLLGGGAFAPGAADAAPWTGFGDAWFALPRWLYASDGTRAWLVLCVDAGEADARWHGELARHHDALASRFVARPQPAIAEIRHGDGWPALVTAITDAIAAGTCAKIVAARAIEIGFAGAPRTADLLATLDERHADCVRLLVRPTGGAALVAATPERLVRRDGSEVECDALAGTRPRSSDDDAAALLASDKDRREHALVVDAIAGALRDVASVRFPDVPGIRALRHMLHLITPIRATLERPCHVLELAARLHPTPAVGGTPTGVALDWIARHEPARGWYAAPVGWFDLDGNGELAIALRSGVLAGERAHLWAGAGIVAGSRPDRELAETDSKLRAMLGALGGAA